MISLAIAAALVQSAAQPDSTIFATPEIQSVAVKYRQCLKTKSLRLERSDADPSDVLMAARTACVDEREDLQAAMDAELIIYAVQTNTNPSHGRVDRTLQVIDRRLSDEVRLAILEQRAARKKTK